MSAQDEMLGGGAHNYCGFDSYDELDASAGKEQCSIKWSISVAPAVRFAIRAESRGRRGSRSPAMVDRLGGEASRPSRAVAWRCDVMCGHLWAGRLAMARTRQAMARRRDPGAAVHAAASPGEPATRLPTSAPYRHSTVYIVCKIECCMVVATTMRDLIFATNST